MMTMRDAGGRDLRAVSTVLRQHFLVTMNVAPYCEQSGMLW
jgi:hypothetical protein